MTSWARAPPSFEAVGGRGRSADGGLGAGLLPGFAVVPVAREGTADRHGQAGLGADDENESCMVMQDIEGNEFDLD